MTYPKIALTILVFACAAATANAQTSKKDLVQKVLQSQQPDFERMARDLAGRSVANMVPVISNVLQTQVPPEKREAIGRSIEADMKKYVEESTVVMRDRALKLAPSTYGAALEEKFSEDELKQLVAWLDSPVNRKYQQLGPDMQGAFVQKLVAETSPLIDPKLQALQQKVRVTLGLPQQAGPASGNTPAGKPAAK